MTTPHVALTIAGSDSGGGAGIQADLRAFGQFGVFGASVITAVTAQNTVGVTDVHVIPAATVTAQIDAVLGDLPVAAVKTGMLATAELVELVAARAAAGELSNLVVDPVLVSATGHRLLEDSALAAYRELLLPHATIATPNLDEAAALLGRPLRTLDDARAAAHSLAELGTRVVVVKGGHLVGPRAVDVVVVDGDEHELAVDRIDTPNTHGTGCTFAAAAAAGLANGLDPLDALAGAKRYVTAAIAGAATWRLGAGNGPLDHLGFGPVSQHAD
ncbi:MAG: bifunctional hydroxymethylpyrimidine kinase/phosphomethylpyrimidine kinase [Actinobacteria bacterium]|jgi:hydroxymethylpyrimidine/phosphomethylpyrimidine kinase|nr:bifunctional hydroxymethylpyrimidine kinase/phosphomethylpyrimidine kinase [Actinomycetota bacterium]